MKRITFLAAIIAGFFLFGAQSVLAATDPGCTALGGTDGAGTCFVVGPHSVTGTITVAEALELQPTAVLTVTGVDLTLNVTVGDFQMDKNSRILGVGRDITINVPNGDMTMLGTAGAVGDKCGYPALPPVANGAQITSVPATIDTTITINVGNYPNNTNPSGSFVMERCSLVDASNHNSGGSSGSAGTVVITAGHDADLDGQVLSESLLSGTGGGGGQAPGGGPITVQIGCVLTVSSTGVVSSKGADPGADLVHLEGCNVTIDGLVQSTGPGHVTPNIPANHCASGVHVGKDANSTGCVEIIGQNITISNTGEVNANVNSTGSGGPTGTSWIDMYAYDSFFLTGRTGAASFLVHANSLSGTDTSPNIITVVALHGGLTGSGNLFQASDTANGSDGGTVNITTFDAISLVGNTPTILAQGHNGAGGAPCFAPGAGACGKGGFINLAALGAGVGSISWLSGVGDVRPDVGVSPPAGKITLTACVAPIVTTGTNFGHATPVTAVACGVPVVPAYITAAFAVGDPIWDACQPTFHASKSGHKFDDPVGDGTLGAPIAGWPINLLTTGNVVLQTVFTDVNGFYHFDFTAPGTFRVCEGQKAGVTSTETFPKASTVHAGETVITTCPGANKNGYEFTIVNGSNFTDDDFANHTTTVNCPEDPTAKLTSSVDPSGASHGVPNFLKVQAAYNAAVDGDVIGMFGNTVENVVLGAPNGDKTLEITQCTSAKITAANNSLPVWDITSTGKLTIIGPDSVGGTNGWFIRNTSGGPHTLKSVRANGASVWGIRINSDKNNVSWNDVSGNGGPGGILVAGSSNILKGGTVGPNNNDGIKITGNSNSVSGATVESNTGNGIVVFGNNNQIKSNKANLNGTGLVGDGFQNAAGTGNTYSGNSSNTGGKENKGAEYSFVTAGVDGNGNRADGVNVPKTSLPTKCADFAQAGTTCE